MNSCLTASPAFSILLPVNNGEKYLQHSITSLLRQTFSDFEILIGLNGCTDKTSSIVRFYKDSRIRIFDFGNETGKGRTLNKLLGCARARWIALQDDDDVWLPEKLEKQASLFGDDLDIIGSFIHYIDEHGSVNGNPLLHESHTDIYKLSFSGNNQIANTSAVFRRFLAVAIGGWRVDIDGIEDFDFYLRALRAGAIARNLPKVLVQHRLHAASRFNTRRFNISEIIPELVS